MSFDERPIKKRMKEWGMSKKEVLEVAERMANFIEKEAKKVKIKAKNNDNNTKENVDILGHITPIIVLKSFFILEEVKKKRYNNNAKILAFKKNKNIVIEKYADKIIKLHTEQNFGIGGVKIAKYLKQNNNVKISPSAIYNFLKEYKKQEQELKLKNGKKNG